MTQTSPRTHSARTNFHSSRLIRCLADLAMVDAAGAGNAFAQKLGSWIHFADAIALSTLQNESPATVREMHPSSRQVQAAASAEFERMQAFMTDAVMKSFSSRPGKSHISLPEPLSELPLNLRGAYLPYRRFYEAHQRDMESSIQPLRNNLREAAAKASPMLRKLAELDAMTARILRERENRLLSKVPVLLMKRFEQLFKEHQQRLEEEQRPDNPAAWMKPNGWLACFCNDMQMLLLAEMEFRLQPARGLMEALKQET